MNFPVSSDFGLQFQAYAGAVPSAEEVGFRPACISAAEPFSHQIISSLEALDSEQEAWQEIVDLHYRSNPLVSLDWHRRLLRYFSAAASIRYVRVSIAQTVVAYFPMLERTIRLHGLPLNALAFPNHCSPLSCPIIRPEYAEEVVHYLFKQVLPKLKWDIIFGRDMAPHYSGFSEMVKLCPKIGCRIAVEPASINRSFEADSIDSQSFYQSRKNHIRRTLTREPNRLAKRGEVEFRLVKADLTDEDIAACEQVYSRSWRAQNPCPQFWEDVMRQSALRGTLRLGILSLDGRPISFQLWVVQRRRPYLLRLAYDEEFRNFAPGVLTNWYVVKRLIDEDHVLSLDYLKGNESYKREWTNTETALLNLYVFRGNLMGSLAFILHRYIFQWARNIGWFRALKRRLVNLSRKPIAKPGAKACLFDS